MKNIKFTVDKPLCFEYWKPLAKSFFVIRRKEISKPFANHFFSCVSKQIAPLLIYFYEIAVGIQRLVSERRFVEQQFKPFFRLLEEHQIKGIELLEHVNGQGSGAEIIPATVVEKQTLQIDTVSGATYSSTVILKAIENALLNASK